MKNKIDELESIVLGPEANNPKHAWLKEKFDDLRNEYPAQLYVQKIIIRAALIGFGIGSSLAVLVQQVLIGCR